ncbi:MAG: outer membrane beta-barrel family protein, partial [Muribaculaceae bacterium]|nr:outer membrane beta-barrel family protein [Muribaculaceae bacterium]
PEYPERVYLTWENAGKDRNLFLHAGGSVNIAKWWNLYSSLTYVLSSQKLRDGEPYDTFGYLRFVASTTFSLPAGYSLTLNCFYNTKMKIGNITIYPIFNLNPTLQKRFGKHWSVSLGLEDMLQRKGQTRAITSEFNRLSYTKNYVTAKLGITYTFNSGKTFRSPRIEKGIDNSRLSKE